MSNNYFQGAEQGICTVASLQWAKKCLKLGRGLGSFNELQLSGHQMNALMAVWRRYDNSPAAQTLGMGLRIVGNDRAVNQFIDVQRFVNLSASKTCIFWTHNHTMGYRVSTRHGRECEFFDIEDGLWVADNDTEIRQVVIQNYGAAITGMRIVSL
ncbi:hypothetical protein [Saccharicrinis sp. GN24d3]